MFRKLRLRMTLLNAGVTILLFVILISGVSVLLDLDAKQTTDYYLQRIAAYVIDNDYTDFPPRRSQDTSSAADKDGPGILPRPRPSFFFVRLDDSGNILHQSSNATIDDETLSRLVQRILPAEKSRNDILFDDIPVAYLRTVMPSGETLIVFKDYTGEKALLHDVVYNLLIVGILCTILSFLASFFLAKRAIRPIQEATDQQKSFVANASHELRTPITIMQANLDIINGAPTGDTLDNNRKWLDNLQEETTRMTELINALLFLARADANRQLLEKEYFPLDEIVKNSVASFEPLAAEKGVQISAAAAESVMALGDPARILQVLTILIDNALHHTLSGGSITISCYNTTEASLCKVADTGEGIAAADLPHIFDRFYQSDSSRNHSGAGLGLSMAKWIIDQHKGTIQVESTVGKGTTFTVSLPR